MKPPRVFLAFESVRAGNGGICRVARLMAQVLDEEQAAGRCRVSGVVLSDQTRTPDFGVQLRLAKTSRVKFVADVTAAHFTHTHFIYDFAGMARAHQWLPWPRRPNLVFMCGIEVWPDTRRPGQFQAVRRASFPVSISDHTRMRTADPQLAIAPVCWLATEQDDVPATPTAGCPPSRVLILGRLVEDRYKGHDELLACWRTVRDAVPGAVLTIVGTGPALPRFEKLAAELPAGSVDVRGFVAEADMPRLWAETAVFAMPSRGEGFGLVYIEAMRHGIPVIASVHDAGPEVNPEGVTGYNVNLDQPDELPARLIQLLRDPALAAKMGANGRERWAEHFRYSAFRDRFLPILRDFLNR